MLPTACEGFICKLARQQIVYNCSSQAFDLGGGCEVLRVDDKN